MRRHLLAATALASFVRSRDADAAGKLKAKFERASWPSDSLKTRLPQSLTVLDIYAALLIMKVGIDRSSGIEAISAAAPMASAADRNGMAVACVGADGGVTIIAGSGAGVTIMGVTARAGVGCVTIIPRRG
jgi:hypothetical protein